jgi:hypothetical protein
MQISSLTVAQPLVLALEANQLTAKLELELESQEWKAALEASRLTQN